MLLDLLKSTIVLLAVKLAATATTPVRNDGIHLAVTPKCGTLTGAPADVNAGLLPIKSYKTIVTFGDSYTDGGVRNGGPLKPAILTPPNPYAGGRATNGPVWAEDIAADTGALLKDYAFGGAVTDAKLWPSRSNASDFVKQVQLFLNQSNKLDPATTLYSAFFGINDVGSSKTDGTANLPAAAQTIIDQITILTKAPTNARSFLVLDDYARGSESIAGEAFKQKYFTGLETLANQILGFKVAFVDFKTLWSGVQGTTPGFAAFGYTSSGSCTVNTSTTAGACSDPAHTFYWLPGHPSKETHRIMADYVEEVLVNCII